MVDVNGVSNLRTIAGDSLPSVHVHTMAMTADEYNTTEAYQSFQNETTNDEATDNEMATDEYSSLLSALLIFTWILSPFVLTGNGLTIAVVMKYIKMVTPTHVGIVFLSFTGLFVGIIPLLNLAIYLMGDSVNAKYIHNSTVWVSLVARGLNVCAILLIAFERCFLVTSWKLYKKHLTVRKQIGLSIAFCVYFVLSATVLTLVTDSELISTTVLTLVTDSELISTTVLTLVTDSEFKYGVMEIRSKRKTIVYVLVVPPYTLATCTIAYCYLKICFFIWKPRKSLVSSQNNSNQQNFQKEKKTTVLIAIILTVYLAGTLPNLVYSMLAINNPKIIIKPVLLAIFRLLLYVATLIDTIIYAWKVPEFQKGFHKILCCLLKSRIIQVAPLPNVESLGNNLPLEPRR